MIMFLLQVTTMQIIMNQQVIFFKCMELYLTLSLPHFTQLFPYLCHYVGRKVIDAHTEFIIMLRLIYELVSRYGACIQLQLQTTQRASKDIQHTIHEWNVVCGAVILMCQYKTKHDLYYYKFVACLATLIKAVMWFVE